MSGWDCGWGWDHNKNNPCDLKPEGIENVFCLLVHVSEKFQSYFSLFTGRTAGITQLAAVCSDGSTFSRYVMPSRPISMEATRATGISLQSRQLLYNGHLVESVSTKDCLVDFIAFLQPLCIGHNIRYFDCPILIYHLMAHSVMGMVENAVHAFLDTLVMYKQISPERRSYKQEALVNDVLGQGYNAHNAAADVATVGAGIWDCMCSALGFHIFCEFCEGNAYVQWAEIQKLWNTPATGHLTCHHQVYVRQDWWFGA